MVNEKLRGFRHRWMRSYVLLILFSSICLVLSFFTTKGALTDETEKSVNIMLNQVVSEFDDEFGYLEDFIIACSRNETIRKFALDNGEITDQKIYDMLDLSSNFNDLKMASGGKCDYYLYFSNFDIVTTVESNVDSENFFQIQKVDIPYAEWLGYLSSDTGKQLIKLPAKDGSSKYLYTAKMMFTQTFNTSNVTLFAIWDEENFEIINMPDFEKANLLMSFSSGNIIDVKTSAGFNVEKAKEDIITGKKGSDPGYIKKVGRSKIWNMNYIIYFPLLPVMSKIITALIGYILIGLLMIIGGFWLSVYFTNKNYVPLKNIKEAVTVYSGVIEAPQNQDESEFISRAINNLVDNYNMVSRDSERQKLKLRDKYIEGLFNENGMNALDKLKELELIDVSFISDRFSVLIIHSDANENEDEVYDKISTLIHQKTDGFHKSFIIEKEGFWVCLINVNNSVNSEDFEYEIEAIAADIVDKIKNEFGVLVDCSSVGVVEGINALRGAYLNALVLMDYKLTVGTKDVLFLKNIDNSKRKGSLYFTLDMEKSLVDAIREGSTDEAVRTVEKIFEEAMKGRWMILGVRCFAYDVLCTLIKAIDSMRPGVKNYFSELDISSQIMSLESSEKIISVIVKATRDLCEYITNDDYQISLLERKVMDFITEHYCDFDLSLQKIADSMNMHPAYLSSSFKEQSGENISNRITKIRLTNAAELLRNGYSVNDTAKQVGYANTRTFSDAFRKYYGKNPSQMFK